MSPLVKKIISAVLFYGVLGAVWAGLVWLFLDKIWWPENFSFAFTDHEFWDFMAWVPGLDAEGHKATVPVRFELTDLRWLGLLCGLPFFVLVTRWTLTDLPIIQQGFNILVRSLLVVALVGSLLNLQKTEFESHVATVIMIDVSESVPDEVLEQSRQYAQSILDAKREEDVVKLITFSQRAKMVPIPVDGKIPPIQRHDPDAQQARLEKDPEADEAAELDKENAPEISKEEAAKAAAKEAAMANPVIKAQSVDQHTNAQAALRLAYGLFPPDHVKHAVILTDGNQTEGDLLGEAYNARTYDVKLYTKHFQTEPKPEVMIRSVLIRDRDALRVGKPFEIELELFSTYATEASFRVWQGEFKEDFNSKTIPLPKGESFVTFTTEPFNPGPVTYKIDMRPKGEDRYKGNNVFTERLVVEGKPRVLFVEGNTRRAHYLERALEGYGEDQGQNFIVEVRPPGGLPNSLEDALQFDCIIFSDTPMQSQSGRTYVSEQNMAVLNTYVRKHGGGFIAVGGEQAFGLGGYQDTTIEKMLPVKFDADLKREHPSLGLALVIDKSGSMEGQKMELAKDAAKATVEVLGRDDRIMVVGFDDRAHVVVPIQRASNRMQILDKLSRLRPGGGTDIQAGLEEAYLTLSQTPARIKHVILLSDGVSDYGTIPELVRQMNSELITVSTIAVGNGADTILLNQIADYGGGRAYFTNDPYSIPRIFLQETSLVTQNAIIEEPFQARVKKKHAMIKGLNISGGPDLFGYVTTRAKDGAEVILTNPYHGDPVLATWRWGIGKTTVFTSDVKNRWATAWVSTRTFFPRFWAQVVRETMRRKDQTFFDMSAELDQGRGHIMVDAIDDDDEFINGLISLVKVTPPQGEAFEVELYQSAPGIYEGYFELTSFGPYYLEAKHHEQDGEGGPGEEIAESRGTLSYPYPTEYFFIEPNTQLVNDAVAVTGGHEDPTTDTLFDPEGQQVRFQQPLWHYFLWAALFLMIFDILFRRVRFYGRMSVPWSRVAGR